MEEEKVSEQQYENEGQDGEVDESNDSDVDVESDGDTEVDAEEVALEKERRQKDLLFLAGKTEDAEDENGEDEESFVAGEEDEEDGMCRWWKEGIRC
jgi:hypothetical protein